MNHHRIAGIAILLLAGLVVAGGSPRREDMPKYLKMLTAKTAKDRVLAADMIGKRGLINANDVEDAIEPLKKMMEKDTDSTARREAVQALGNIRPEAKTMVPMLIDVVKKDKVMDVKLAAVVALGQYAGDAREALPSLRELAGKFDAKKSKEGQTIVLAIQAITGKKKG